ncbi:MAG: SulP family inorganic anion transporter [Proteobacteria bacterium]|nr:SulP family inorganic anion transporter [Pseudomonadota bacterium]
MLNRIFPFLGWFKDYDLNSLKIDAVSGLTVALVLIPQSMAYAQLAGLPPYYGLYASFLPPIIAALFGSSRQLATGPVAVVSLMTSASLEPLATAGSQGYIAYAILLALMVGIFQLTLGVLRLGLVVNFLSHPVVNGFTNAAAIIIASSQLSKMFGVYVDKGGHNYETIIRVIHSAFHYTHWPTLLMGVFAFAIMYGLKQISPKIPNVLVAVAVTIIISWAIGYQHNSTVNISAIKSPKAQGLIESFNKAVNAIPRLAEERTKANMALDEANSNHDILAVLDDEHVASVLTINIERVKRQAHIYRKRFRNLLFEGIEQADGSLKFYLKDAKPPGSKGDGRTWRIKVGNYPLKKDKIIMMGGGAVVGAIPQGLPSLSVPKISLKIILHMFPFVIIISLLGFMEAISIAKAMAGKTGQRLDPNQELIGQGLANICGSFAKSYPTSGSFSRSAVNLQSGAISGLSSAFTSLTVVIVLLFFTPLLYYLPQSVLAAIIMMAVIGLVNASGFIHAWKAQWYDGFISIVTFLCTLLYAPHLHIGIMIGVILSLLVFLYKSMRPVVASLSWHEEMSLQNSMTHNLQECKYIDLIRFEGTLFFANASYLEDKINERMIEKKDIKHIVILCDGINDMDASGEEALSITIDRVRSAGVGISLSGVNESVMSVLKRTYLLEKIGEGNIFSNTERAIFAVHDKVHKGSDKGLCPLSIVCQIVKHEMTR